MKQPALLLAGLLLTAACASRGSAAGSGDPLPSWNDGATKSAIVRFVEETTMAGGPGFVPVPERIATFDNDGTLWGEQPIYFQLAFALDRVAQLAPQHPEWQDQEPFKSVLAGDVQGALAGGEQAIAALVFAAHAGMTTEEFDEIVVNWLRTARHPVYGRRYDRCIYQPMLELLAYLRASGFKTFIVSGGGVDFMRAFAEPTYGIPPEQVVGSSGVVELQVRSGVPVLQKTAVVEFVDDGPGKPVGIHRFIGRRPVMAFGNSDGDLEMLQWTTAGAGPRFAAIVHHTDGEREVAYDRDSKIGKLDKALDQAPLRGWTLIDMKRDWKVVFPP
jgi:phosphoglycolate phosphatase-like HAD superfamily hydrolase